MSKQSSFINILVGIVLFGSTILSPMSALAFSAYGAGTAGSPYRISTCAQLSEINNDLSANYVLVANIDCASASFTSLALSAAFTGTLDGQSHTIKNLNIAGNGLFSQVTGGTIKNINLASGSISGTGYVGSIVGIIHGATLINVHSSLAIVGEVYNGGLVGLSYNDLSISNSSYGGSITSNVFSGGLVGLIFDSGTNLITDSYFDGTFTLVARTFPTVSPSHFNGGIVGLMYGGTIANSYAAGSINYDNNASTIGGLVGLTYHGVFNHNFSAIAITGVSGTGLGALFGVFYTGGGNSSTRNDNYFDRYLTNTSGNCAGTDQGSGGCTAVNVANATPAYFMNNSTNGPFGSWDFSTIWQANSGYPKLRSFASFADAAVPNSGDANGDGTQDSYQPNVTSLPNSDYVWSTIEVPFSSGCSVDQAMWSDPSFLKTDTGYSLLLKTMTGFSLYCSTPGATVPVTIIYDKLYDTSKAVLRHFNNVTNTYSTVQAAVFGTRTVGGVVKSIVSYDITDGGSFDTDGLSNGVIVDPVVPSVIAVPNIGAPNTGLGKVHSTSTIVGTFILGIFSLITAGFSFNRARRPLK